MHAKKVERESNNGELDLLAQKSYNALYRISERAKTGDTKLWDDLPERVKNFYPGLNYIKL